MNSSGRYHGAGYGQAKRLSQGRYKLCPGTRWRKRNWLEMSVEGRQWEACLEFGGGSAVVVVVVLRVRDVKQLLL
jgi:hypothetical protein